MGAWLEIRINSRSRRLVAGLLERDHFRMTYTFVGVEAFPYDLAVFNNDRSDHCPGAGQPPAFLGEFKSSSDVGLIIHTASRRKQRLHKVIRREFHEVVHFFSN